MPAKANRLLVAAFAVVLLCLGSGAARAQCAHLGGVVGCPPGVPVGSFSLFFQGNFIVFQSPGGPQILVPDNFVFVPFVPGGGGVPPGGGGVPPGGGGIVVPGGLLPTTAEALARLTSAPPDRQTAILRVLLFARFQEILRRGFAVPIQETGEGGVPRGPTAAPPFELPPIADLPGPLPEAWTGPALDVVAVLNGNSIAIALIDRFFMAGGHFEAVPLGEGRPPGEVRYDAPEKRMAIGRGGIDPGGTVERLPPRATIAAFAREFFIAYVEQVVREGRDPLADELVGRTAEWLAQEGLVPPAGDDGLPPGTPETARTPPDGGGAMPERLKGPAIRYIADIVGRLTEVHLELVERLGGGELTPELAGSTWERRIVESGGPAIVVAGGGAGAPGRPPEFLIDYVEWVIGLGFPTPTAGTTAVAEGGGIGTPPGGDAMVPLSGTATGTPPGGGALPPVSAIPGTSPGAPGAPLATPGGDTPTVLVTPVPPGSAIDYGGRATGTTTAEPSTPPGGVIVLPPTVVEIPDLGPTVAEGEGLPPIEFFPLGEVPPTDEELGREILVCRVNADGIVAYPRLTDPLRPADKEPSRHEPPIAGNGVLLQDGSFSHEARDLEQTSPGMPLLVARHYRNTVHYEKGGSMGQGWSLNLDRRIVPQPARQDDQRLLGLEDLAIPRPVVFHDGAGRADRHEPSAEPRATGWRPVFNWGRHFRAHVTTYASPPGAFWEVQRYLLVDARSHPFGGHPNVDVERGEALFYVLRDKDGGQQVFNCRGQLVYVLDRHDNRMVLEYGENLSPLTQNPMLERVRDTAGRQYRFETVEIDAGDVATHWRGAPLRIAAKAIPRFAGFTDFASRVVRYGMAPRNDQVILSEVVGEPGDGARYLNAYGYDASLRLQRLTAPEHATQPGSPWLFVRYDAADRVLEQIQARGYWRFDWGGKGPVERLPDGATRRYELVDTGAGWAAARILVTDPAGNGGPWNSVFKYNLFGQLTLSTLPRGNRIHYVHEIANAPVTRGPVSNAPGVTYLNNLAAGNLMSVERLSIRRENLGGIRQRWSYEPLYNEIETETDGRGNVVLRRHFQYFGYGEGRGRNGNPMRIEVESVAQPHGEAPLGPLSVYFDYEDRGLKTGETDQIGGTTSYRYDALGYPERQTRPDGSQVEFRHDDRGNLVRRTEPGGRATRFVYDRRDLLVERIDDPGGLANRTVFEYDRNRNLVRLERDWKDNFAAFGLPGRFREQPDTAVVVEHDYDLANRRIRTRELVDDEELRVTEFRYDGRGRLTETVTPSPAGDGTVATRLVYDARSLAIEEIRAAGTALERRKRFEFDENGNARAEYEADGTRLALRQYDGYDRLLKVTDARGTVTSFERDENGNPVSVEVAGPVDAADRTQILSRVTRRYDELNRVIRQTSWADPERREGAATEHWRYDERGLLTAVEHPNGAAERYEYDALGRRVRTVDAVGNVTSIDYNEAGDLAEIEVTVDERRPGPLSLAEKRSYHTRFRYDGVGRVTEQADEGGQVRRWYDSLGRLRAVGDALGLRQELRYDGLGRRVYTRDGEATVRLGWNLAGMATDVTPSAGPAERTDYDALGQAIRISASRIPSPPAVQEIAYDSVGRVVEVREPGGIVQRLSYDSLGQTVQQDYVEGARVVLRRRFAYDGLGRLIQGSAGQTQLERRYDGLGNMVSETQSFRGDPVVIAPRHSADTRERSLEYPSRGGRAMLATWHYDKLGRLERLVAGGDTVAHYAYNGRDRLQGRVYDNGAQTYWAYGSDRMPEGMETWYSGTKRWSQRTDTVGGRPTGQQVSVANATGRPGGSSTTISVAYDGEGHVASSATNTVLLPERQAETPLLLVNHSIHGYDPMGRLGTLTGASYSNGKLTQVTVNRFAYDSRGRISRVVTRMADSKGVASLVAQATPAGTARLARQGGLVDRWKHRETQAFVYDERDRLVRDRRFSYKYDPDGRLTGLFDEWATYQRLPVRDITFHYDVLGRLAAVEYGPGDRVDNLRLIYDDRQVIAELAFRNTGRRYNALGYLAYYLYGGRTGELVRMDRRRDENLRAPFESWYVHEDLDRRIAFLTSATSQFREIDMRDDSAGSMTRMPFIEGTNTAMPYLGHASRHFRFLDSPLNETQGTFSYNYRSTPYIRFQQEMERFNRRVYNETWELQAAGTIVMSLPLVAYYSVGMAFHGVSAIAFGWGQAALTGRDYTASRALADYGIGGIGGYFAGAAVARLPVGAWTAAGLDYTADTLVGTLYDVVIDGDKFTSALASNAVVTAGTRAAFGLLRLGAVRALRAGSFRRMVDGPSSAPDVHRSGVVAKRRAIRSSHAATQVLDAASYDDWLRRLDNGALADPDGYALFRGVLRELEEVARGSDAYLARWARTALQEIDQGVIKFRPFDDGLRLEVPVNGARVANGIAFGPIGHNLPNAYTNGSYLPDLNLIRINPLANGVHKATPRELVATFLHEFSHAKGANEFESWYIELRTLFRLNPTGHPNIRYARRFAQVLLEESRIPARWGPRLQYFVAEHQGYSRGANAHPWLWEHVFRTGVTPY